MGGLVIILVIVAAGVALAFLTQKETVIQCRNCSHVFRATVCYLGVSPDNCPKCGAQLNKKVTYKYY